ncbi:type IX secretion system membrane protein PorP/SprF [Flavobacterium agricola]|uniref:Type IX secretion system membrane protein PorP/SprF n=1 Tax=Flavobacterium agricola TaxID=2870839 RepID=A0ABY6M0M9_9FLAO|nr:type IX secretion system membrane protein PorP/SprF [Flavobacterium agricola]UYW00748.1 type IX secretion system membrane protein PorP/SprF [Flavobacterium agricola]
MVAVKRFLIGLFLLFFAVSPAQEGISVYSDYLSDNYYLLFPSMAGAANCAKLRITARQQWFGQPNAPQLQTLSFNSKMAEDSNSGIGLVMYNDQNGFHSQRGAKATFAHHLIFNYGNEDLNQFSFGLSAGFDQTTLDQTRFTSEAIHDPNVSQSMLVKGNDFNVDFGFSYFYGDFYSHAVVKNALGTKRKIYSDYESFNMRKFIGALGYTFGDREKLWYEPSVLFQYTEHTKGKTLDLNLKLYKPLQNGTLWGGISYRNGFDATEYLTAGKLAEQKLQYITPFVGVNMGKFMISYSYSYVMGDVAFDTSGFHQLTIGFDFLCKRQRFLCNCPGVN